MEKIENANYLVQFPKEIERVVKNGVDYAIKKKREYCKVFGCKMADIPQLKASIFTNRKDFVDYIKKISGGQEPPEWAIGCFYSGEIQIYANENNVVELNWRMGNLAHETVHLMFDKLIYNKFKIQRVTWLDESFANYLDGIVLAWTGDSWQKLAERLLPYKNFDVNKFNNRSKIITNEYDGYDMFHIIGKYIFENNLQNEFLEKLKCNRKEILALGKTILATALDWFIKQNNLKLN